MVAKRSSSRTTPSDNTIISSKNMSMAADHGPSDALIQLIAPDGYYTYLGIPKPSAAEIAAAAETLSSSFMPKTAEKAKGNTYTGAVNEDVVKKAYRYVQVVH
jgi:hypothetical protein